jgi:hypothetical protein
MVMFFDGSQVAATGAWSTCSAAVLLAPATPTAPIPTVIAIAAITAWTPVRDRLRPLLIALFSPSGALRSAQASKVKRLLRIASRNLVDIRHIEA